MKIIGGIKGIANNQRAIDEFFLTAGKSELSLKNLKTYFKSEEIYQVQKIDIIS